MPSKVISLEIFKKKLCKYKTKTTTMTMRKQQKNTACGENGKSN